MGIFLVGMLSPDWQTIRILIGMFAGTAFGAMVSTLFPALRAPRRVVDPLAVYRKFCPLARRSADMRIHG
ncbi:hypothetical protein [Paraburkholderia sp. EG304]|uniref:hypothetical protein n=1 Tax=Paraburkholderia sp. EG304 TaxID=3237015 RepID=UPI00397A1366